MPYKDPEVRKRKTKEYWKKYREKREAIPELAEIDRLKRNEICRKWYYKNQNKSIDSAKNWQRENKARRDRWNKEYRSKTETKAKRLACNRKRELAKIQRTPPWLTKDHLSQIEEFYLLAKELQWLSEEPLQVDHIVPLQGENVSGLHVPWNLQILTQSKNASKNNKF
jgi:5-methylcytosine-specific restriction endonuclease McrA